MILSHRHKFIFFCNAKTGTSSIETLLRPLQEGPQYDFAVKGLFTPKHVPPALLKACLPQAVWRDYFKFAVVRNPWDWFISNWFFNWQQGWRPPMERLPPTRRHQRLLRTLLGSRTPTTWPPSPQLCLAAADVEALFRLLKQYRGLPGADGCYQSSWVFDAEGEPLLDRVLRFETLDHDFARLQERLHVHGTLPHINRTGRGEYRRYFSPAAAQRVAELWAVDVKNFGYTFDEGTAGASR